MSKHNFQETLDNESDLRKTLGYNKVYNDLKNNFLVLKMHQNAPQSMQIFKIFWGRPPIRPFSIVLVKLAFNANRNSRKKPKKC